MRISKEGFGRILGWGLLGASIGTIAAVAYATMPSLSKRSEVLPPIPQYHALARSILNCREELVGLVERRGNRVLLMPVNDVYPDMEKEALDAKLWACNAAKEYVITGVLPSTE